MHTKTNQTAVLYFTRRADEEARAKSFCGSSQFARNRAIAKQLIDHTHRQVKATGLPVKVFTSAAQRGSTFGTKLANAFQALFDEGYDNVISVGNDCLQLSAETINRTARLLNDKPVVAGPTTDGGAYLMGLSREAFHQQAFSELAWQTDTLLDDFASYAAAQGLELACLDEAMDIDDEASLRHVLRITSNEALYIRLVLVIQSILNSIAYHYQRREINLSSFNFRLSVYHRGPPCRQL